MKTRRKPRRGTVPAPAIRTDRVTKTCSHLGCSRTISALGPKAAATVRYNLNRHREAAHAKKTRASDTVIAGPTVAEVEAHARRMSALRGAR